MKVWSTILKILAALAAVAGVIFVIVKYGDKIVAWCKGLLCKLGICTCPDGCDCCEECDCCEGCEECEDCEYCEEAPAAEIPAEEGEVQAEEKDFE